MRDPSWRAAALGGGRDGVQAIAVAAATALLVLTASAGPLVAWTSGQAAIERLVAAAETSSAGGRATSAATVDLVATVPPDAPAIAVRVDERLDAIDGFEPAVLQVSSIGWLVRADENAVTPVVRAGGETAGAVLFHREGAVTSLEVVAGPDPSGEVWLPDLLADRLGVAPGDTIEVGLDPVGAAANPAAAPAVVAGVYATESGRPTGTLADPGVRLPPDPEDRSQPAALVLADAATVQALGAALGDLQVTTLEAALSQPPRYEDLRRGVGQLEELERELYDPGSELGAMIFEAFNGPEVRVTSRVRRLVTQAETTAAAVTVQTGGTATAGVLLAVATVVTAIAAGARRSNRSTVLELVQGAAPVAVAGRAVLVVLPWVLLGSVLGRVLVLPAASTVLPVARVPGPAVASLTPRAVAVAAAVLLLVLAVRTIDAWFRLGSLGGRDRARPVPLVPVLLALAGVVTLGVVVGPPRPPTDPLVMLLPIVVIAAVAVLALRGLVAVVPRGAGRPVRDPTAGWLARRRLGGQSTRLVAIGAIVAVAAGLVANTSVLRTSGAVAVEAKAAAVAGAAVVVEVPLPSVADGVGGTAVDLTVVLEDARVRVLPENVPATLLVVDPSTFATAATWPAGTSPEVLGALATADGPSLPVLAVGGSTALGDGGTLDRDPWWVLPYEVVGRPAALPGAEPDRLLLLTSVDALTARLGPDLDPFVGPLAPGSSDPDGPWATQVWLDTDDPAELLPLAAAVPIGTTGIEVVRTLEAVRAQPAYVATQWGLWVLGGLGFLVLLLALLLLGGTRARGADEAGLELVVLRRLGVPLGLQRRAAVLERVLLVAVAGLVGIATGTVLATAVAGAADPAPEVVPPLRPVLPTSWLVGLAAALLLGAAVAGLLDHRAARRADIEEALRVAR